MDLVANTPKTLGAMVDSVHSGHVSKESLAGANITRGLLAPNMLFAGY
jgi:hypothetical protein